MEPTSDGKTNGKLTRREFIGLVLAGLAALGLAGCKPFSDSLGLGDTTDSPTPGSSLTSGGGVSSGPGDSSGTTSSSAGGVGSTSGGASSSLGGPTTVERAADLVVVAGREPTALIERGLAAFGGIEHFVAKGARVVIKPNFSVPRTPEQAATTNPQLVAALVRQCLTAGAKEVKVVDYPFSGASCLVTSGIKDAVEEAGGTAYNINKKSYFQEVKIGGEVLVEALFAKDVLEADVFINMPILKHHSLAKVTLGMKNMMGLVWDRGYFHRTDLHRAIAELAAFRKPDLIVMDAIRGIVDHGPSGPGTIKEWGEVIFGLDPVAVDAYGATLFGLDPYKVGYIREAADMGLGEIDLNKLTIERVSA
ncbi:MAG: DUF362 domain-containing protein [Thermoleophilia bacterium]|nr:DUF362 domain-containing protein [Thermoleophilia bacterium]